VKNLSIVSKILTILGTFGVFVVAVIIYATSQMNEIDGGYQRLASTAVPASLNMTRASQSLNAMQANIEWVLMATTPADDQAATDRVAYNRKRFDGFMGTAESDAPAQATEISALQTGAKPGVSKRISNKLSAGLQAGSDRHAGGSRCRGRIGGGWPD
jgi:hypothetical protein